MLSVRWRGRGCTFVLFCLMMVIEPWLVKGDFSCYSGTVDILKGELNVASTKSIVVQQCSPPTTQQPPTSTPGVSSTMRPATTQSDNQTTATSPSATSAGNQTTPGIASASPEALSVTDTKPESLGHNEASASVTAAPLPPKAIPKAFSGLAAETPSATSTTPLQTRESGGSVVGCVVTKSYHSSSGDSLTATFSCPASDSPCIEIGFNSSKGADNQTQCCVGVLCNTLDSFIMREHFSYSTVDSCFVGMTDANETQCGDSSNMCLTIIDSSQVTTEYYCGNVTLQRYCQQNGTLREGSFKQRDQIILTAPERGPYNITRLYPNVSTTTYSGIWDLYVLHQALDLQNEVVNLKAPFGNDGYVTLEDICYAPLAPENPNCVIESVLNYFQNSHENLDKIALDPSQFFVAADYHEHLMSCAGAPASLNDTSALHLPCLGTYGGPIFPWTALGGYEGDEYNLATALIITFPVVNYITGDPQLEKVMAWEAAFIHLLKNYNNTNFTIAFQAEGENITVDCCGSSNCNTPIPSTTTPPSTNGQFRGNGITKRFFACIFTVHVLILYSDLLLTT